MLIIRDRFAILTQRIKSSQTLKIDSKNKFQNDRNLSFRISFEVNKTAQSSRRHDIKTITLNR